MFTILLNSGIAQRSHSKPDLLNIAFRLLSEKIKRAAIRSDFAQLSERELRDLGMTPHDVTAAISGPLNVSCEIELHKRSSQRARNW